MSNLYFLSVLVISALLFNNVYSAIDSDKVTSLPGFVGPLPSTHYSGCK